MNKVILTSLAVLFILNGATSQRGFGFRNGGLSYTFKNDFYIVLSGTIDPFTVTVGIGFRFRRAVAMMINETSSQKIDKEGKNLFQ